MDQHRKPLWPWIVVLLIGLPVLYVASFGPACWITSRMEQGEGIVTIAYRPILSTISDDATQVWHRSVSWYAALRAQPHWGWYRYSDPTTPSGRTPWQWGQLPRY